MKLEEQKKFIIDNWESIPIKRMASIIGRSTCFVKAEMNRQGIVIPKSLAMKRKKSNQFNKNHKPHNKGLKQSEFMSKESIEASKKTWFKKGRLPHNTLHDLYVSKRKDSSGGYYYQIRISLGEWELLHRYIWKLYHGEIPEGYNIQFKDGDSLNCDIKNLYMVNRKHQLIHNLHGGNKLPMELKETLSIIQDLKDKINEKQNNRP